MKFKLLLLCCAAFFISKAPAQLRPAWTLVWADEFSQPDGSAPDPTKWGYDIGGNGWGNNELEYYTSRTNNARIEGGQLVIEAKQESFGGRNYTSARLLTKGKWSWTYGRIEARLKVPRGQGIWPAFWTLGTNIDAFPWPQCGEIDIMENIGREPAILHGTVHGPGYSGGNGIGGPYTLPPNSVFADDFHVFAVEWETNRIRWFVDGQQYFSVATNNLPGNAQWVFNKPQFLLLNVAVGGTWPGNPDGTTTFPQRMLVDYVRVYAQTNVPICSGNVLTNPGFELSGLSNWSAYGANFNTVLATSPVRSGTNGFKVFGQFTGSENYSGLYQDRPSAPGQSYAASGWALTATNDKIAGANTAWIEVAFRDAAANNLSLYRSSQIASNSAGGAWLNLAVTNQFNPTNFASLGPVASLMAPVGTTSVRYQIVFRQPQSATGSVFFDELSLTPIGAIENSIKTTASIAGGLLSLSFDTLLSLAYQLRYKNDLSEANWLVLTNIVGAGNKQSLSEIMGASQRFYQVGCLCN